MAYVVTDNCNDCKFTTCAEICPVEAFHEGPNRLFIHPETCIDCNACVPECPVEAIYPDFDVPDEWKASIAANAENAPRFPVIAHAKDPLKGPKCVNPDAA